jgi:hypothetical protein
MRLGPLGIHKRRWEGDIKMDVEDLGWGVDWIDLVLQDGDRWGLLCMR